MTNLASVGRKRAGLLDTFLAAGLALFLALLPFHLVIKWLLPGAVGTYWKEILLGILVVLWVALCVRERRLLRTHTPLDLAVALILGLTLLRFLTDGAGWVEAWGAYVTVLYLPLFWLVPTALGREPRWLHVLFAGLAGVGAIVAAGGLLEFVLDVSLWPSVEVMQRSGLSGIFIYGTQIRRVYFTFDSPTTLANTLAMLLPLALSLVLTERKAWARAAAGVAAALMAACIVVTFSRGIWVAAVIALLVMGIGGTLSLPAGGGFVRRNWRPLALAGGALVLLAAVWALATVLRPARDSLTMQGVIELSPGADANLITGSAQELLKEAPILGQADIQTWTLPDPFDGGEDSRAVLYAHPPESGKLELIYSIRVPANGALRFAIAMAPEVWSPEKGDGVSFELYVVEPGSATEGQPVFVRYINPKHTPSDRRWRSFLVDLSLWTGRTVNLSLVTTPGRSGDWAFDWAGWANPQLVSVQPGAFASAAAENAVLRHTGSILDWARDETNRDRLAAWSLGLGAWRSAPLWGTGLGSTGAAALRTVPETAFVTESQVLKALVELGPLGLLALAYLWFQIARVGLRAYRSADDPARRVVLLGLLTSLLIVFIEGWVYQNLEVKQVNAYFWTLVGALAFLARRPA